MQWSQRECGRSEAGENESTRLFDFHKAKNLRAKGRMRALTRRFAPPSPEGRGTWTLTVSESDFAGPGCEFVAVCDDVSGNHFIASISRQDPIEADLHADTKCRLRPPECGEHVR